LHYAFPGFVWIYFIIPGWTTFLHDTPSTYDDVFLIGIDTFLTDYLNDHDTHCIATVAFFSIFYGVGIWGKREKRKGFPLIASTAFWLAISVFFPRDYCISFGRISGRYTRGFGIIMFFWVGPT
jgi:hypothetical protein